ncbi:MAG: tRNA-(ms[2]io[6]A)-hydroxylase [Gammaproteobacteria bacterium]
MVAPATSVVPSFAADVPAPIAAFLAAPTPKAWIEYALTQLDTLLQDHANCEKKAASTALATLHRYAEHPTLVYRMSRLAREELRHFEQVNALMAERGLSYRYVEASRYAGLLRAAVSKQEPRRLSDTLICGAFIEARSCERFAALAPFLDAPLARFYRGLLASEARHFEHYLDLAEEADDGNFEARVAEFRQIEWTAICTPDERFNFHSGPPHPEPLT